MASACKQLDVYILRPPNHGQLLLANAQYDWLQSKDAQHAGWNQINQGNVFQEAQRLTNKGYVVVAIYQNPNPKIPGHVALVIPEEMSRRELEESGPILIMAGTHNHNHISLRAGFKSHIETWPAREILFFANAKLPAF